MNKIKNIRLDLRMTQKEFAESLNVKRGVIAQIETGKNNPTAILIEKIKEVHNVNVLDSPKSKKENIFDVDANDLRLTELAMLLSDNLKILYVLCSILKKNDYKFNSREERDVMFYFDLEDKLTKIRFGNKQITDNEFGQIEYFIKFSIHSKVNHYINTLSNLLKLEIDYYNYKNL